MYTDASKIWEVMGDLYERIPNCIYIGLYGSQNYHLDDEKSDLDFRAVVLPTLDDLIYGKRTSKTFDYEHGQVDVKDVMSYAEVISKGNFSFIEPFQTDFRYGSEELRRVFGSINLNYKALWGAMHQKLKKFEKDKDPKNVLHVVRLDDLYGNQTPEFSFLKYTISHYRQSLIELKRSLEKAENVFEFMQEKKDGIGGALKGYVYEDQKENLKKTKEIARKLIKRNITETICSEGD